MARPIRETPILFGKDTRRFEEEMKRVEAISTEVRKAEFPSAVTFASDGEHDIQ